MDLHGLASQYTAAVNPLLEMSIAVSTGYATDASGKQNPTYAAPVLAVGDIQPLSFLDLKQSEGVNEGGVRRAIYLEGQYNGVVRPEMKGGDLVTISSGPSAGVWLVNQVLEQWPTWCKVHVTLQNGS